MARIRALWFWLGTAESEGKTKSTQFSGFFSAANPFGTQWNGATSWLIDPPTVPKHQAAVCQNRSLTAQSVLPGLWPDTDQSV
jgi:hypothetical protein